MKISQDRMNSILFWVSLCIILIFALVIRMNRIDWGLPYLYYWDEPQTAGTALQMLKAGTFNPNFFNYGSLPIYIAYFIDIFHYLFLMGQPESAVSYLNTLSEIKTWADTQFGWTISHPSFYYWNRFANVLFGLGSLLLTYKITNTLFNRRSVGLVAVSFLAVSATHVEYSAIISPDMPVVFFALAVTLYSLKFLGDGQTKHLTIALIFSGCALATKYNSILVILLPALSILLRYINEPSTFKARQVAILAIVPMVTFFICMPYALIEKASFLSSLGYELRHYRVLGHGTDTSIPGIRHIRFQAWMILGNIGLTGALLCLLGLSRAAKTPKLLFILIFPLAYFFYMTTMKVNFHRNFILIYPYLAVLYGAAVAMLYDCGWWLIEKRSKTAVAPSLVLRIACLVPAFLAILHLTSTGYAELNKSRALQSHQDSRSTIVSMLNVYEPKPTLIYISKEIRMHEQDLRKLKSPYKIVALEALFSCSTHVNGSLAVIPAELESGGPSDEKLALFYTSLMKQLAPLSPLMHVGRGVTRLSHFSIDPKLLVIDMNSISTCNKNGNN
jgi:4-amino-4-deoxy-L-arabinose transferase-like glycosyltransferase